MCQPTTTECQKGIFPSDSTAKKARNVVVMGSDNDTTKTFKHEDHSLPVLNIFMKMITYDFIRI